MDFKKGDIVRAKDISLLDYIDDLKTEYSLDDLYYTLKKYDKRKSYEIEEIIEDKYIVLDGSMCIPELFYISNDSIINEIKNAEILRDEPNFLFDFIYFVPNEEKHDSDYNFIDIYGKSSENGNFYKLSSCSDVMDIINDISKDISIDFPNKNVGRIFTRGKFMVEYLNCSSFRIDVKEKEAII